MSRSGRCYCGEVRYESTGDPVMQAQCHCRECQYLTGGSANVFMAVPEAGLTFTQGQTKGFKRDDIEGAVTREFCPNCGTHILTRAPGLPGAVVLKAGTLDGLDGLRPQIEIYADHAVTWLAPVPGAARFGQNV